MASATMSCPWCGRVFAGEGYTQEYAQEDANSLVAYHTMYCSKNPANGSNPVDQE
jgi:hypothetical protein